MNSIRLSTANGFGEETVIIVIIVIAAAQSNLHGAWSLPNLNLIVKTIFNHIGIPILSSGNTR